MNQLLDKAMQRSVCISVLASLALGLCLFVGQGFHRSTSIVDLIAAGTQSRLGNANPIEPGVKSLERQIRNASKAPRRHAVFGALPPSSSLALPDLRLERSLAEARCEGLITRSFPNDRAPPTLLES